MPAVHLNKSYYQLFTHEEADIRHSSEPNHASSLTTFIANLCTLFLPTFSCRVNNNSNAMHEPKSNC